MSQSHQAVAGTRQSSTQKSLDDGQQSPPQQKKQDLKQAPDFGWTGPVPSREGGDGEQNFLEKPPYSWTSDKFVASFKMQCFCGNVAFEIGGEPYASKYCHCRDCQRLHGAPFQHAVIFPKTSARMTSNKDDSVSFYSSATRQRKHHVPCKISCRQCGSPLFDEGKNTVLTFPGTFRFPDNKLPDSFKATAHIFYAQRSIDIKDGVPKWAGHVGSSERLDD